MIVATLKTFLRSDRSGISRWAAAAAVLLASGAALAGGTNTYKFTNNEGAKARDLHIEFDARVNWNTTDADYGWQSPAGTFKAALGSGTQKVDLAEGVGGLGVDVGNSLELTFAFPGDEFPQVKRWWWTSDGEGTPLGTEKKPTKQSVKFEYASAGGGGRYRFDAHGQTLVFQTIAGEPTMAATQRLAQQINSVMAFAQANPRPGIATVVYQGTAFGAGCDDYRVTVLQQDRAGPLTVTPIVDCPADLNGDGQVDFADYLEFLNLFDEQSPAADFNDDGLVDFADYLEFLNLYGEGCPEAQQPCGG